MKEQTIKVGDLVQLTPSYGATVEKYGVGLVLRSSILFAESRRRDTLPWWRVKWQNGRTDDTPGSGLIKIS